MVRTLRRFCGLTRNSHAGSTTLQSESPNWVYRYEPRPGKWTQILPQSESMTPELGSSHIFEQPLPRYAHQVVYNPNTKTVYLHGGNAGLLGMLGRDRNRNAEADGDEQVEERAANAKEKRLDDCWQMSLVR